MVSLHAAIVAMALCGAGQSVLLDFYSDTCPPCQAMEPTIRALIDKGYPVQRVNVDRSPDLRRQFNVRSWPCFVMLVDGREVDRVEGGTSFSRLERMCLMAKPQAREAPPPVFAQLPGPVSNAPGPISNAGQTLGTSPWQSQPAVPGPQATPTAAAVLPAAFQRPAAEVSDAKLIAASVRLRVEDPTGHSCGSGTIIDAQNGMALILTCGHIFRESNGKGKVEVDLFGPNGQQRVPGRCEGYDSEKNDVGLVSIVTTAPVAVARVAPPGYRIEPGQPVITVGCDHGDQPTARRCQVRSVGSDHGSGPAYCWATDQPVEGRSGGGLFSADGRLLGVCNAADPNAREGYYAALGSIYDSLDRAKLSFVYRAPGSAPREISPAAAVPATLLAAAAPHASLPPHEQAALDNIHRKLKEGATVVCIVNNPNGQSEVYMLDRASSDFRKQLAAEGRPQTGPHLTSFEVPQPRKILLEWSAEPNAAWKAEGAR